MKKTIIITMIVLLVLFSSIVTAKVKFGYDSPKLPKLKPPEATSGAGNVTNLDDLNDTNVPSPNDGDALLWDSGTNKWISGAVNGSGGGNATGGNPFDQSLNTTDNVVFNTLNTSTNVSECTGTPNACNTYGNEATCLAAGCDIFLPGPGCIGSNPSACSTFGTDVCTDFGCDVSTSYIQLREDGIIDALGYWVNGEPLINCSNPGSCTSIIYNAGLAGGAYTNLGQGITIDGDRMYMVDSESNIDVGSVAFGRLVNTTGGASIGIGWMVVSEGGTAIGVQSSAYSSCTAIGAGSECNNIDALTLGAAISSGMRAIAVGKGANASFQDAISIGTNSTAREGGISIGLGASSAGLNSISIGGYAFSVNKNSVSIGTNATSLYDNAMAIGVNALANATGAISIGAGVVNNDDWSVKFGNRSILMNYNEGNYNGTGNMTSSLFCNQDGNCHNISREVINSSVVRVTMWTQ